MDDRRVTKNDLIYMIFVLALPLSWASFVVGSLYRTISIILILAFVFVRRGKILLLRDQAKLRKAFMVYVVYTSLTILWTPDRAGALKIVFGMVLLLLIAYIFASNEYNERRRNLVDYCWIVAGAVAAVLYLRGGSAAVGVYGSRKSLMILGTATDPNEFAGLFIITIPLMLYHFFSDKRIGFKVAYIILVLAEFYVVLLSGSRGALIGTVIACVIALLSAGIINFKGLLIGLIAAIIICWVIYSFVLPNIPADIMRRLTLEAMIADRGSGRTVIWVSGMTQWAEGNPIKWLIGYGVDGIQAVGERGIGGTLHNTVLQQIVNYGLIGLAMYLYVIWMAYTEIRRHNTRYLGAFWGMMFMSLTLSMGPAYKPLWILLMMGFVVDHSGEKPERVNGEKWRKNILS